jgi:hypothetical protein
MEQESEPTEEMYDSPAAEMLCFMAQGEGISLERPDISEERYWLYPGVTGWSFDRLTEWVKDLLADTSRDWGMTRLPEGPLEVELYGEA